MRIASRYENLKLATKRESYGRRRNKKSRLFLGWRHLFFPL